MYGGPSDLLLCWAETCWPIADVMDKYETKLHILDSFNTNSKAECHTNELRSCNVETLRGTSRDFFGMQQSLSIAPETYTLS